MNQKSESDWKHLGSLASGILRLVEEKRIKQAEFIASEKGPFEAALPSPQGDDRIQFALPLALLGEPLAGPSPAPR